ncbi:hypothetical protein HMSSN139_07670 [Paenibacillus sp. HMSSN-139]|nr:hypothetical protein HMSSN139_07670 [Paenibacillus sp. HMSSN-139]
MTFSALDLYASAKVPKSGANLLEAVEAEDIYGAFEAIDGGFRGSRIADDRLFVGDEAWDDYEMSVQVGIPEIRPGKLRFTSARRTIPTSSIKYKTRRWVTRSALPTGSCSC